jgi:esterase/lipase
MVIETYYMSSIEKYVYYIIKNKMQKNERIILSQILSLVRNFKGYKIENEKYFYDMAKKIKDKVRKKLNAKNQAETE